ncbi:hypothetical protein VN97_g6193 [Penicillium thymicola]|uniref:Uncharacterized protein n=1 Tax=Penicillium thymicola TaxID=293382 RepID=A0AAI9THG6_PENTH|nr:hypothetical protein VN97_g6193 [Penicillium thymicola]
MMTHHPWYCLRRQHHTTRKILEALHTHLPFPSPSTLLPSPLSLSGPPWSPSENVVPIHLPCGDPRRSPYRLL